MGGPRSKAVLFEQFARVGKALGSGKRLELLDLLAQGERTVDSLASAAGLGLTTASAHVQTLKQASLVETRREGTKIYYRLAAPEVAELYALLGTVANDRLPDVAAARAAYLEPETEPVARDELVRRAEAGEVIVLDVRPAEEYVAGHIPGALSIPIDEQSARLTDIPADQEIVAYCRGAYCVFSHEAVRLLTALGRPARRLVDGMLEWRLADLPVATG